MKKIAALLLVTLTALAFAAPALATNYALCVGINEYKEISSLEGCVNDANHFFTNLVARGGWLPGNMTKLTDSKATKNAIRKAISNYAAKAVSGDTFVYNHSSHGGQISGTDTYLCVYDEVYEDDSTAYNDWEVAADLQKFAAGVKVVVIVDACHSGGLFRDAQAREAANADLAANWDFAGRVSTIMEENRAARLARGERGVEKTLAASEIGWVTAAKYSESSYDGGYYADNQQGGVFMCAGTEGWMSGAADTQYGDGDGYENAYEFWAYAYPICTNGSHSGYDSYSKFYPQHTNDTVLKSVDLGWAGDEEPGGLRFATIPAQVATVGQAMNYGLVVSNSDGSSGAIAVSVSASDAPAGSYSLSSKTFTFTPPADQTYSFTFLATNATAKTWGKTSMTVNATLAAPSDLANSGITDTAFTANWSAVPGAASYFLEVFAVDPDASAAAKAAGDAFELVTSADDLTSGEYLILAATNNRAMKNTFVGTTAGVFTYEDVTVENSAISTENASIVWTLEGDASSCTLFNADAGKFVNPSTTRACGWSDTASGAWELTLSGGLVAVGNAASSSWSLQYNASSPRFAMYEGSGQDLRFFRRDGASAALFSGDVGNVTSYTVTDLIPGDYQWRVRAIGNAKGPFSEFQDVTLNADPTAPPSIRPIADIDVTVGQPATATVAVSAPEEAPVTSIGITDGDPSATLEDGVFTFVPVYPNTYDFTITAVNANGSTPVSFTVTATLADPEQPETPAVIGYDAFTAAWDPIPGAESYEIDVVQGATSGGGGGGGGIVLSEDFSNVVSNNTSITDFSTVTTNAGWSGENAAPGNGMVKFGTSNKAGTLLSPAVAVSGKVTVTWTGKSWANDNAKVNVGVSEDGGKTFTDTAVQLTETLEEHSTTYTVTAPSVIVRWQSSAASRQRFFITQLSVSSGSKARELSGTHLEGYPKNVGDVTSYVVSGLQPLTEYSFAIRAVAGDSVSEWSPAATVTTTEGPAAPVWSEIPAQAAAVDYPYSIDLSSYVSGSPTPAISLVSGDATLTGTVLSFTPAAAQAYSFTVNASNDSGEAPTTFTVTASVHQPTKYAVCVGINEYAEISGLEGCVNDSIYIENSLIERGGWPAENVVRLNDKKATKAAIRAAIAAVAAQAQAGDTFVYQHSSHGGQFNDTTGEIITNETGKATFLCVYDEEYDDNTTAYNDYEIAADMAAFNAGVKVAVIVDACHSGGLFKSKEEARAAAASFDLAGRVTAIMDADRAQRKARGENVAKTLSSSEIGWATACEYYETSYDGGFYHTDEWLTNNTYGDEYWVDDDDYEAGGYYDYPTSYKQGGVFTTSAAWGWWNGTADADPEAGDNDGLTDVYEFWKAGYDFCSVVGEFWWEEPEYNYYPQCTNTAVLKSIELGWVKDPRPAAPANPKATAVTASSFTASWDASENAASYNLFVQKKVEEEAAPTAKADEEYQIDESFEDGEIPDGWTASSDVAIANGKGGDGDYCVAFKGAGANLITPAVENPSGVSFMYKRSSNTADWRLEVSVGPSADGPWTPLDTVKDATTTWQTFSFSGIDASGTQYVKLTDGRSSGAAERYIDLVQITGSAGAWEDVAGFAPAAVADTSKTVDGLDSDTDYRFWVTAIDGEGVESADSAIVTLHTAAEDSAPVWSEIPELAAVAGEMSDFTASDYVTASPAATITLVSVTAPEGVTVVEGDDYEFEDGYLVFTPPAEGSYAFEFKAENDLGDANATLTVVAAGAPVLVPELTLSNPTANSFKAEWTACTDVSSYTLQVSTAEFKGIRDSDAILSENFTQCDASDTNGGDITSKLDQYTGTIGWTGSKVFEAAGRVKLGSSSAIGYIVTPAVNIPAGAVLTCKIAKYGTDTGTVDIQLSANGGEFASLLAEAIAPVADGDTYTVNFAEAVSSAKIKFISSAKRFYLDDVVISGSGGGSSVLSFTVEGTSKIVDGLEPETTYYARVKGAADWSAVKSITTEADVPVAPAWSEIPAQTVVAGENLVLDLTAYVSGSPKPTITADAGTVEAGVLTVSYAEAGEYTIALTASNSEGDAPATLAVTVTAAPVTVPELTLSNPTANSFDAVWTACTDAETYQLQVATASEFKAARDGEAILSEDFAKCDGSDTNGGEITSTLDDYTVMPDWSGFKVFEAAGRVKLGTGKTNGWIATPAVDIPAGASLSFKIARYGTDKGTVDVQLSANGGDYASLLEEAIAPVADGETFSVDFAEAVPSAKIKFVTSANRAYVDDVVIAGEGGGSGSVIVFDETTADLGLTVTGLDPETTYYARVRMTDGDWSEVQSITTQAGVPIAPEWLDILDQTATVGLEFGIDLSTYVTGSPFPTIYVDNVEAVDGNWSFTPTAAGEFTFELVATNTEGSDSTTLTVVVSEAPPAPVTVPELTLSHPTETSFDAAWTECTDATGYQLQVATDDQFTTGGTGESTELFNNAAQTADAPEGWTYAIDSASGKYLHLVSPDNSIVSPAVSTKGFASLSLDFRIRTFGGSGAPTAVLDYSTDGENWTKLGTATATTNSLKAVSVDATACIGLDAVQFRWTCPDSTGSVGVGVDKLVLSGEGAGEGGSIILDESTSGLSYAVGSLTPETTYYARVRMTGGDWSEVQSITTSGGGEPVESNIEALTIDSANGTLSFEVPEGATVMWTTNLVIGGWGPYEGEWPIPMTGGPAFFRIGNPPAGE